MSGHDVRAQLAMAVRALAMHGMMDGWSHASLRVPKSAVVLVTPRFSRRASARTLTADDLLVCDLAGNIIDGGGELPRQYQACAALYRRHEAMQACFFVTPRYAMAAGASRFRLRPLTHMESEVAYEHGWWDEPRLADAPDAADSLADTLARCRVVQQPGIGAWTAGASLFDALADAYHLEYLAQVNAVMGESARPRAEVSRDGSRKIWRQFAGHDHYFEFFAALDPGPRPHPWPAFRAEAIGRGLRHAELKAAIAMSCRALWERDTLVAFLEHISHRLPGGRFLISAATCFRDMAAEDMCELDLAGNWLAGPKPPGFKWFHAQLLAERRDAMAVVHTHDVYGRVYALAGAEPAPCSRIGLEVGARGLPQYPHCDLVVDADVRRATLDALGAGPQVHEAGHGTDFVATTLEQATVDAIEREAHLAMHHLARRFGEPRPMPPALREAVARAEAPAEDRWWHYLGEVGMPRRSAAGL